MNQEVHAAEWDRYTEMIPEELRAAGWRLWAIGDITTVFGGRIYSAVLLKNLDNPSGARTAEYGATGEEALRGAIREALAIEVASQAQTPQE
jgi:hypothetical protein